MISLAGITGEYYHHAMSTLVTTKGQVTIPKSIRDRFGIRPGVRIDFTVEADGIRLRKTLPSKRSGVFGCLKHELAGRSVDDLMDELRGDGKSAKRPSR
jgi:AbrB family looped-hinge helix DNA binding protein